MCGGAIAISILDTFTLSLTFLLTSVKAAALKKLTDLILVFNRLLVVSLKDAFGVLRPFSLLLLVPLFNKSRVDTAFVSADFILFNLGCFDKFLSTFNSSLLFFSTQSVSLLFFLSTICFVSPICTSGAFLTVGLGPVSP